MDRPGSAAIDDRTAMGTGSSDVYPIYHDHKADYRFDQLCARLEVVLVVTRYLCAQSPLSSRRRSG